jgi:hypothetical protein
LLDAMDTLVQETTMLVSDGLPAADEQRALIELLAKVRSGVRT